MVDLIIGLFAQGLDVWRLGHQLVFVIQHVQLNDTGPVQLKHAQASSLCAMSLSDLYN